MVPEGAQTRHFYGQPGGQHALELICWEEEGAYLCIWILRLWLRLRREGLLLTHDRAHSAERGATPDEVQRARPARH